MQNVLQRITGRVSAMSSENFITPYKKGDFIGQKYVSLSEFPPACWRVINSHLLYDSQIYFLLLR